MTLGFAQLAIGDVIELKGPIGHFVWLGNGMARIHEKEQRVREVGMVCGGSGVTPILQVLRGVLEDTRDGGTTVSVLDINRHLDDILCRAELDALAEKHPSRFQLRYSLTGAPIPDGWEHSIGRVNVKMLQDYLPAPTADGIVCICGPPLMERFVKGITFSEIPPVPFLIIISQIHWFSSVGMKRRRSSFSEKICVCLVCHPFANK